MYSCLHRPVASKSASACATNLTHANVPTYPKHKP